MQEFIEIRTPNGDALKFKLWADRGGDDAWFRTRLTAKVLGRSKKKDLPIVGCWNGGQQKLVLVDYDAKTPEQAELARELCAEACYMHDNALGFQSVSGNPRVAFLVEVPEGVQWDTRTAAAYLKSKLPERGHWFDTKGMQRLYVGKTNAEVLAKAVPGMLAEKVGGRAAGRGERRGEEGIAITIKPTISHAYYLAAPTDLPSELRFWASTPQRTQLLRILTACWGLQDGFNLPVNKLAQQLACTPTQASRMLKDLQQLGVLRCTDASYAQGKKAKTYKAAASLLYAIQKHKARVQRGDISPSKPILRDGKAYGTLLSGLAKHTSEAAYLAWAQSLPGCNPERYRDAKRYWQCHERKAA